MHQYFYLATHRHRCCHHRRKWRNHLYNPFRASPHPSEYFYPLLSAQAGVRAVLTGVQKRIYGTLYFSVLGTFPVRPGTQNLYRLTSNGFIKVVATGLTAVLGVAFDAHGHLFALEADTVAGFPGPQAVGSGTVVLLLGERASARPPPPCPTTPCPYQSDRFLR